MSNLTINNITMEDLNNRINELRDILNEISSLDQDIDLQEERLMTSKKLDELIVKYMKGIGG